ncbi:MAG: hypothetical protein H5U00_08955 [Clostridia bacterium]|nr:hypothetical protein [Clostridia bacterium]
MQRRWPVVLLMAAILGLIPASGWVAARTPDHVQLFIEGTPLMTAVPAKAVGTRVMVPLRDVFAALGAAVEWQAPTQTVTVKKNASVSADLPVVGSHEKLMSLLEQAQQWIAAGAGLKTGVL